MQVCWRARAPVRFCDLGGWTDTRLCSRGAVLSLTSTMRTYVEMRIRPAGSEEVEIRSLDTDERVTATGQQVRKGEYQNTLDLFQAAVRQSEIPLSTSVPMYGTTNRRVELLVSSDAPPGSGLGTSAALGVAAVGVLALAQERPLLAHEAAELAQLLETLELKLECGVQDQAAAAYGGVSYLEIEYPDFRRHEVPISTTTRCELERRLVLIYTGTSHFSSDVHEKVIAESQAGRNEDHFRELTQCALSGRDALAHGDLEKFGIAMERNWTAQKALHPDITSPEIEALYDMAHGYKAVGFKANGAGGGGTVTVLASPEGGHAIKKGAMSLGMQVLPSTLSFEGLQTWRTNDSDQ